MAVSPNISEIVTTTLVNYNANITDNISNNNPLLYKLKERGNMRLEDGGVVIRESIFYAENTAKGWYSKREFLRTNRSDVLTAVDYEWKQYHVGIGIDGLEMRQNSGKWAILNLLKSRITNAYDSMYNDMGAAVFLDGTQDGGRAMGGLALLVSAVPNSGVVGGIDRGTTVGAFWRNQKFSATIDGGAALTSSNILNYVNRIISNTSRNGDKIDLIILGSNYYALMQDALITYSRYMPEGKLLKAGFASISYQGIDIIDGGGVGSTMDPNIGYFLNTKYIKLVTHKDQNFEPLPFGERASFNQDAMMKYIGWMGNMVLTYARGQAVLIP